MAWNPSPKVADCREIARRWGAEQVIIIAINEEGRFEMATFGRDKELCDCALVLGEAALEGLVNKVKESILEGPCST